MKSWNEIKKDIEQYKKDRFELVKEFEKDLSVQCKVNDKTYHGRVKYIIFDDEKGQWYVRIDLNSNKLITWSSGSDNKKKFYDDELNQIKIVENILNVNKYNELLEKFDELDDKSLTRQEREAEEERIKREIIDIRLNECIHEWEEVESGSWLDVKIDGYQCKHCDLLLDKEQEIDYENMHYGLY